MKKLVVRSDDFDFRMPTERYIEVHEKFIDAGLIETAVIQVAKNNQPSKVSPELLNYMRTAPNWDIQLHCWDHDKYSQMEYKQIVKDIAAAMFYCQEWFGVRPTIWYPPWNERTETMEEVALELGLVFDNESCDIKSFVRNFKTFNGNTIYFHSWNRDEMTYFADMLQYAKEYAKSRGS